MSRRVAIAVGCALSAALVAGISAPAEALGHRAWTGALVKTSTSIRVASSVTPPSYLPVLHQGARGKAVAYVQRVLRIPVTGNYGPRSVAAVKAFQAKHAITPANGVIGKSTWSSLIAYAKAHPPVAPVVAPSTSPAWATTSDVWAKFDPEVERFALCVAHHESWLAGLWTARNPHNSASGAFQYIDSSWRVQSRRAGVTGYARAYQAPPDAQALTFAVNVSKYHAWSSWNGTNCGHGT
jgi:hypothetical protein